MMLGIVGLWIHIFIERGLILGVGVGLSNTVSKTLVCNFLCCYLYFYELIEIKVVCIWEQNPFIVYGHTC